MLSLFFALVAFAGPVRFTPYADLKPDSALRQYRAAVHLLETDSGRCSATEISSQGDVLTARHCLQICLIRSGAFRSKMEQGLEYFELDPEKLGKATCTVKIDGKEEEVTIQATSPGLILYLNRLTFNAINPQLFHQLVAEGYMDLGDFAVFRRPKPGSCVPLSREEAAGAVKSLGYPSSTQRPGDFNSDGVQLYFTSGDVLPGGIRENACVQKASARRVEELREEFDHPGAFMSTLDVIYGSSGSSVLNGKGEAVGVLTNMYVDDSTEAEKAYCYGSAKALSSPWIRKYFGAFNPICAPAGQK